MQKILVLILISFSSQITLAQMSLHQQVADFTSMIQAFHGSWANKQVHEQASGLSFDERAQDAYRSLVSSPLMTNQEYAIFISRFLNSLSDGHIYANLSKIAVYDFSSSTFKFAESEEGLVLMGCEMGCKQISLPALVTAIDGAETETWINDNLNFSRGSTIHGKRHQAILSLSKRFDVLGVTSKPTSLRIKTSLNQSKTLPFFWSKQNGASPSTQEQTCVSSHIHGQTLILKVPSFVCDDIMFPQDQEKGLAKFRRELLMALTGKSYKEVLIDLRGNGGGLPLPAKELISYFIQKPLFWFGTRDLQNPKMTQVVSEFALPKKNPTSLKKLKSIPLWMLTDGSCFSQCSIFVVAAKLGNRAKFIGQPIDPGAGSYMNNHWQAPSGLWTLSVPPWIALAQDGKFIEAYPMTMDIETKPPFSKFFDSQDPTLVNALEKIKNAVL